MNKILTFLNKIVIQDVVAFIIGAGLAFAVIAVLPILYIFVVIGGVVLLMNQTILRGGWWKALVILLTVFWPVPTVGLSLALYARTNR